MSRVFAIGDIHGCNQTFQKLVLEYIRPVKSDHLYCIGDYIDRGPDSKGVIDFILHLRKEGFQIHTLRGNHEQLMLDSVRSPKHYANWYDNGGDTTLRSFGVTGFEQMDPVYQDFFRRTRYFFLTPAYIFVHAGLSFIREDPFFDRDAMLWIRSFQYDAVKAGGRMLVHGHTPQPMEIILRNTSKEVINIDAGCVYTHKPGMGHLVAINLSSSKWLVVNNVES